MRASGSTVTTHSARRSLWIRMGIPSIESLRWCAPKEPKSASAPWPCLTCRAPCRCGRSVSIRSSSTTVMRAQQNRDPQVDATASSSRTTTPPNRGWCSTGTWPGRMRASPSSMKPASTCPRLWHVVVSGGASVDNFHRMFGSLRLRYFGPRPLVADNSVRSKATTLLNLEAGTRSRRISGSISESSISRIRP